MANRPNLPDDRETGGQPDNDSEMPSFRALKIVVFSLAGFLFLGLAFVVATILYQANELGETDRSSIAAEQDATDNGSGSPMASFGTRRIPAPADATLIDSDLSNGILMLRYRRTDGSNLIQIVDLETGALRGTIELSEGL